MKPIIRRLCNSGEFSAAVELTQILSNSAPTLEGKEHIKKALIGVRHVLSSPNGTLSSFISSLKNFQEALEDYSAEDDSIEIMVLDRLEEIFKPSNLDRFLNLN